MPVSIVKLHQSFESTLDIRLCYILEKKNDLRLSEPRLSDFVLSAFN